ncbi:MAG: DUF6338 family protein [Halobacteriota archaeon]
MLLAVIAQDGIFNPENLALFLVFFIPGFISVAVYSGIVPNPQRDISKDIYKLVTYSTLNFIAVSVIFAAVLTPLGAIGISLSPLSWIATLQALAKNPSGSYPNHSLFMLFSVFILFPVLWALLAAGLRTNQKFQGITHNSPYISPLYQLFSGKIGQARGAKCLRITLKGQDEPRVIQGLFAAESAINFPTPDEIYLQLQCKPDGNGFGEPMKGSSGILIFGSEISTIEVFDIRQSGCARCVKIALLRAPVDG